MARSGHMKPYQTKHFKLETTLKPGSFLQQMEFVRIALQGLGSRIWDVSDNTDKDEAAICLVNSPTPKTGVDVGFRV